MDEPTATEADEARTLARRYLRRRLQLAGLLFVLGIAAMVGGCGGYVSHESQASTIADRGGSAVATVTAVRHYRGRGDLVGALTAHADLAFVTQRGERATARIGLADNDKLSRGERVRIRYDPDHPSHAQLASGDSGGRWFTAEFVLVILGLGVAVAAGSRLGAAGDERDALDTGPRRASALSRVEPRALRRRDRSRDWRMIYVRDSDGWEYRFWALTRRGWHLADGLPIDQVDVFGDPKAGAHVVVVHRPSRSVAAGRIL